LELPSDVFSQQICSAKSVEFTRSFFLRPMRTHAVKMLRRFGSKIDQPAPQVLGGFALRSWGLFITHPLEASVTVTKRVMIAFRDVDVEMRYERTLRAQGGLIDVSIPLQRLENDLHTESSRGLTSEAYVQCGRAVRGAQ
jgi:hypothetical protein